MQPMNDLLGIEWDAILERNTPFPDICYEN